MSHPCPACSINDLSGNYPGPEVSRGECCPDCGHADCRACGGTAERCVVIDGVEVWFCHAHAPTTCECCGEVAVADGARYCAECWANYAPRPAVVFAVVIIMPAIRRAARQVGLRGTVRAPSCPESVETPSDAYEIVSQVGTLAGFVCLGLLGVFGGA